MEPKGYLPALVGFVRYVVRVGDGVKITKMTNDSEKKIVDRYLLLCLFQFFTLVSKHS